MKYVVKDIEEPDFGCEGLPDGQVITDKVTICDENGNIIKLDIPDAYLYEKDINIGDSVLVEGTSIIKI